MIDTLLRGRIHFHIQCASVSPLHEHKHRRKRSLLDVGSTIDKESHIEIKSRPSFIGWIFSPHERPQLPQHRSVQHCCYVVSAPQQFQYIIGEAARLNRTIIFDRFSLIPIEATTLLPDENTCDCREVVALLEIKADCDISIQNNSNDEDSSVLDERRASNDENIWTLEQLARLEAVDRIECVGHQKDSHAAMKAMTYTFRGLVVAVSPILVISGDATADPFALLQVAQCDDSDHMFHAVVVLRKQCVACQTMLAPGVSLVIREASKKSWRIPELVNGTASSASSPNHILPSSVYVVDRASWQIQLDDLQSDRLQSSLPKVLQLSPSPLSSLEGRIVAVHYMVGANNKVLHFMDLVTTQHTRVALFVTYFPMSTALQLSLRVGASIRAAQLYNLGSTGFAACICSHVALLCPSTDDTIQTSSDSLLRMAPSFHLLKVRRSYTELWCRRLVGNILSDYPSSETVNFIVPSLDDLVGALTAIKRSKHVQRNVYAEFFNGRMSARTSLDDKLPAFVSMERLQFRCFDMIRDRLSKQLAQSPSKIHTGWTASIQLFGQRSLVENFGEAVDVSEDMDRPIYTLGSGTLTQTCGMTFVSLIDGRTEIHVVVTERIDSDPGFVWVRLCGVVVSCMCIHVSHSDEQCNKDDETKFLPSIGKRKEPTENSIMGPCSVIKAKGCTFIVSMFIVSDSLRPIGNPENGVVSENGIVFSAPLFQSLQDCLTSHDVVEGAWIRGLLVRSIMKRAKVKSDQYKDYSITLAETPAPKIPPCHISCMQSIDFKLPVSLDGTSRAFLEAATGRCLSEGELAMGLAWWKIASNGLTCALHAGGWDEAVSTDSWLAVIVCLPSSAGVRDLERGYTRIRCRLHDVVASVLCFPTNDATCNRFSKQNVFHCVGGSKFVTGMLDRRPRRRKFENLPCSELIEHPVQAGIPRRGLAMLLGSLCDDLKSTHRRHLAPSLVHELRRCKLLGITYCRALAECSQCYSTLREPIRPQSKKGRQSNGLNWSGLDDQPSFWHLLSESYPPSQEGETSATLTQPFKSSPSFCDQSKANHTPTRLQCPNNCPVDRYGVIKWECSATIDDGTCQAKLFAERETALCILGLSKFKIESIEDGAWLTGSGIVFSKSMPPKPSLRADILTARSLALDHRRQGNQSFRAAALTDEDVLLFLMPTARAEYLLQWHCLLSKDPLRQLTYFVRCKPLSDGVVHLNQTAIEVAGAYGGTRSSRDVASYSLPPLKLHLVDCCSCSCIHDANDSVRCISFTEHSCLPVRFALE